MSGCRQPMWMEGTCGGRWLGDRIARRWPRADWPLLGRWVLMLTGCFRNQLQGIRGRVGIEANLALVGKGIPQSHRWVLRCGRFTTVPRP